MAAAKVIIVMVRDVGFHVLSGCLPGQGVGQTIATVLGLQGGYMSAEVLWEGDPDADAFWVAWTEGEVDGRPNFEFHLFDGRHSRQQVAAAIAAAGEEEIMVERVPLTRVG